MLECDTVIFMAMKNPDALRIFSPQFFGGKFKSLKKQQQTDYFVKMAQRPSEYGNFEIISCLLLNDSIQLIMLRYSILIIILTDRKIIVLKNYSRVILKQYD